MSRRSPEFYLRERTKIGETLRRRTALLLRAPDTSCAAAPIPNRIVAITEPSGFAYYHGIETVLPRTPATEYVRDHIEGEQSPIGTPPAIRISYGLRQIGQPSQSSPTSAFHSNSTEPKPNIVRHH